MTEFDYDLFHALFDNLHKFDEYLHGDEPREGARVEDDSGNDITACLDLSIFEKLKQDEIEGGENVDLVDYFEIKEGEKVVGAKGIVGSSMDWCDLQNPFFYYEVAHLENSGGVQEYVRELYVDEVVRQVLSGLDKNSDAQQKGSDESRALVARATENAVRYSVDKELTQEQKDEIKYRCFFEREHLEVWKAGFHNGPYQLFLTAPCFISEIDTGVLFNNYLSGKQITQTKPPCPLEEGDLEERLQNYDPAWYNIGVIDLDPERTLRIQDEQKAKEQQELLGGVYNAALAGNFQGIDLTVLPEIVTLYTPRQIALMKVAGLEGEGSDNFTSALLSACAQYCPDKLKEADRILARLK